MRRRMRRSRDRGATAVEYALLVALIVLVVVVLIGTVGHQVFNLYSTVPQF